MPSPQPERTPEPIPSGVRACPAADLAAAFRGWQGATGSLIGTIAAGNRAATACLLEPHAVVTLLDGTGRPLPMRFGPAPLQAGALPVVLEPRSVDMTPTSELRRGQATIGFVWMNWCGDRPDVASAVVALSGGRGELRVPVVAPQAVPRCDAAGAESSVATFAFSGVAPPAATPRPLPLDAAIEGPSSAAAGTTFRYLVTLRNTSASPFRFDGCPGYVHSLDRGGVKDIRLLNCEPAGTMTAGATVAYQMVLELPTPLATGDYTLTWALLGPDPIRATAKLTVVPR